MVKRGGGEVPWLQFDAHEQAIPKEQADLLAGLTLFQKTVSDFHAGLANTNTYATSLSSQRRERQGVFLAFQNHMASALRLAQTLEQRVVVMTQTDTLYVDAKAKRTPNQQQEYAFFVSAVNPHTSNVGQLTEGIGIALISSLSGKPEQMTFTPREVRSVPEGTFDFIVRPNQDEHLTLWGDRSLEAYVQVEAGRMPLSQSPAFERILNTIPPRSRTIVEQTLRETLQPTLPAATWATLTREFDGLGMLLLSQKNTDQPQE